MANDENRDPCGGGASFRLQPLKFDKTLTSKWPKWKNIFDLNMKATGKSKSTDEEQKIAILLTHMGEDAIEVFSTFTEDKSTLDKVIKLFDNFCVPNLNLAVESFKFSQITQSTDQSFDQFLTELKNQAENCQFVCSCKLSYADRIIVDHIIKTIPDKSVQQSLLSQTKTLSLNEVSQICRAAEAGKNYSEQLSNNCEAEVNYTRSSNKSSKFNSFSKNHFSNKSEHPYNRSYNEPKAYYCKKCGTKHLPASCPAYGKQCPLCGKPNHFEVGCFKRRSSNRNNNFRTVNEIENNKSDSDDSEILGCDSVEIVNCNNISSMDHYWKETILVKNCPIDFKLDTASDVNILPLKIFRTISDDADIENTRTKIKAYGGFIFKPLGEVKNFRCQYQQNILNLNFIIVDSDSTPILSGNACRQLNLVQRVNNINVLNNISNSNCSESSRPNTCDADLTKSPCFQKEVYPITPNQEKSSSTEKPISAEKENFIETNKDLFSGIGKLPYKVKITLSDDAVPVVKPVRRLPEILKEKLRKELNRLEKLDIIEKVEKPTDWVHDTVIIEKKDGSVRLCLNPIPLNKYIKREHFLIPTQEELTANLSGRKLFTVLDMKEGFHQFQLDDKSSELCTMNTPFGRFKYKRMPYGMSSFPEIFQRENTKIFGDLNGVQVLFDDIIVSGKDEAEHDQNLAAVLKRARENNVKFNKLKLQYKSKQVRYGGVVYSIDGVKPDPNKIKAIKNMVAPKDVKTLRRFLGAVNYINKFLPAYSKVTAPLRELLKKKVQWKWTSEQEKAFLNIKELVVNAPTLKIFNPSQNAEIQCDASKDGLGCCLLQNQQPVAFASRSLNDAEKRYSQIEKEMLSVVFAVNRYHQYIYGHDNIKILNDHKPLVTIVKRDLHKNPARLQRMQLKLLKYKFTLEYLPGSKMYIADMLSRAFLKDKFPEDIDMTQVVHAITLEEVLPIPSSDILKLQAATAADQDLSALTNFIRSGWVSVNPKTLNKELKIFYGLRDELSENEGLIFLNDRLVIPKELRNYMVNLVHSKAHLGITKTVARIKGIMYWPSMFENIADLINSCATCQRFQNNNVKEPLIPSETPQFPFQIIGIDIGEHQKKTFLVVEDYYSKWLDIIPLASKTPTEIIKKLKILFCNHGTPTDLRCDNNPFKSEEMSKFAEEWNFRIVTSSPRYPRSNGLSEKGVGIAKKLIKKASHSENDLYEALQEYRNTPIIGLNLSPSQLLMGRLLRNKVPTTVNLLKPRIPDNDAIRQRMENIKRKAKAHHDKTAKQREPFHLGQSVYMRWDDYWKEATITKILSEPRSYLVQSIDGTVYRRNSSFLRPRRTQTLSSPPRAKPNSQNNKQSLKFNHFLFQLPKSIISDAPARATTTPDALIPAIVNPPVPGRAVEQHPSIPVSHCTNRPKRAIVKPRKLLDYL